jgi:hypothetical protein
VSTEIVACWSCSSSLLSPSFTSLAAVQSNYYTAEVHSRRGVEDTMQEQTKSQNETPITLTRTTNIMPNLQVWCPWTLTTRVITMERPNITLTRTTNIMSNLQGWCPETLTTRVITRERPNIMLTMLKQNNSYPLCPY